MRESTQSRLDRFTDKTAGEDACWPWLGRTDKDGYGRFQYQLAGHMAHRISLTLSGCEIPAGYEVDHLCRNRACVNPAHLEPVTRAENNRRRAAAITHCIHGHEFTQENTYIVPSSGFRGCRTCIRDRSRKQQANHRANAEGIAA